LPAQFEGDFEHEIGREGLRVYHEDDLLGWYRYGLYFVLGGQNEPLTLRNDRKRCSAATFRSAA
ncbi:MAG: hypothetical protein R3322_20320, partial [Kiloniellales bacterium]|nr:hypothetical protein [Kiloniellales bacterium]